MVSVDGKLGGALELQAAVRPEVREIVAGLRKRGIKHLAIISGDHEAPTRKLAESLGMDRYFAQVLPADKADYVEKLQKEGRKVCFVGDGINDSIALKKANVSISLRGASSIATDTAHIVFLEEGLAKLCELRDISKELDHNVKRSWNLILAPNIACIVGVFTLGFGIMASVVTNNVAALAALGNGMLPLRQDRADRGRAAAQARPEAIAHAPERERCLNVASADRSTRTTRRAIEGPSIIGATARDPDPDRASLARDESAVHDQARPCSRSSSISPPDERLVVDAELSLAARIMASDANRKQAVQFIESIACRPRPLTPMDGPRNLEPPPMADDHANGSETATEEQAPPQRESRLRPGSPRSATDNELGPRSRLAAIQLLPDRHRLE